MSSIQQEDSHKLNLPQHKLEYTYNFEIHDIKRAYTIHIQRCAFVQNSKYFSSGVKRRIRELSKNYTALTKKLVSKRDLNDYVEYQTTLSALILVNLEITDMIYKKINQWKWFHLFRIKKQIIHWERIVTYIVPDSLGLSVSKKYPILFYFVAMFSFGAIFVLAQDNISRIIISFYLLMILIMLCVNLNSLFRTGRQNQTKYKYSYRYFSQAEIMKTIIDYVLKIRK